MLVYEFRGKQSRGKIIRMGNVGYCLGISILPGVLAINK